MVEELGAGSCTKIFDFLKADEPTAPCYVGSRVGKKGDENKRCLPVSSFYDTKYILCVR